MSKEKLLKNAEVEWGLKVGPKSNQRQQTQALINILSQAIDQTKEETIREVEKILPERIDDNSEHYNDCLEEIKQSLINLRSK